MTRYDSDAIDQYMIDELTDSGLDTDTAANALTSLHILTNSYPQLFPGDRTFVRIDYRAGEQDRVPCGVRFIAFWTGGHTRILRLPIEALNSIDNAVNSLFDSMKSILSAAA